MNSFTIGRIQSLLASTTTDNQCPFSNTFTTLSARGLSQHPASTVTSVISIDGDSTIAVGGLARAANLLTEAGQLLTSDGTKEVSFDVETTSQVLTANSSAANGIEWANLPITPAGSANYGVIIGTTPPNGTGTISIGYGAGSINSNATNCIIIGTNSNCGSGASNTIILGTGTSTSVSNEFNLPQIDDFNIPNLTTLANGTGTQVQYGGTKSSWVQASGGTYNSVEKIDTIISTIQGQLPAKMIFTTTLTNLPNVSWTVPAGVNSVIIEASGSGAPGTPAIATSTSGIYQGGGGGGSGQIGNITVPVAEGMVLTIKTIYASCYSQAFGSNLLFFIDRSISIKLGSTSTNPNFNITNLPSTLSSSGKGTCSPNINSGYSAQIQSKTVPLFFWRKFGWHYSGKLKFSKCSYKWRYIWSFLTTSHQWLQLSPYFFIQKLNLPPVTGHSHSSLFFLILFL